VGKSKELAKTPEHAAPVQKMEEQQNPAEKKLGRVQLARSQSAAAMPPPDGSSSLTRVGAMVGAESSGIGTSNRAGMVNTLQRQAGNARLGRMAGTAQRKITGAVSKGHPTIQFQLLVNQPGDAAEQEADRVAAHVTDKQASPTLQRQATSSATPEVTPETENTINASRGKGQSLSDTVRAPMENSMGTDLSGVNIHTDATADQLNRSLNARAFTTGKDIFFKQGEFNPNTSGGRELLAHELTHTVQQNGSQVQRARPRATGQAPQVATAGESGAGTKGVSEGPETGFSTSVVQSVQLTNRGSGQAEGVSQSIDGRGNSRKERLNLLSTAVPTLQRDEAEAPQVTYSEEEAACIAPEVPPQPMVSYATFVDIEVPDGKGGTRTQRVNFRDEVTSSPAITLYAVPLAYIGTVIDESRNVCEATDMDARQGPSMGSGPSVPFAPFTPAVTPSVPQQFGSPPPPFLTHPIPQLPVVKVVGDVAITTVYTTFAVNAGSIRLVKTAEGYSLIDAGVGNANRAELTQTIMEELRKTIGSEPILEVLLSHLHEDHTWLLPELAKEFQIGRIRAADFQLADPRMVDLLVRVAEAEGSRIRSEIENAADRTAWESDPNSGVIDANQTTRDQRWKEHVERLVEAELAKSAIILENAFVDASGEMHLARGPLQAQLKLPKTKGAPVMLERGFVETSTPMGGPRVTTARPQISMDLSALREQQAAYAAANPEKPPLRVPDPHVDANEATYIIEFGGAMRMFVSPDKRAGDYTNIADRLQKDVKALNEQLRLLGREQTATLQIWDIGHHAQAGVVGTITEMEAMIKALKGLTRVKLASGITTMDVVIVSGQGNAQNPEMATLIDPMTIWLLREMGLEVFVANRESIEVLEVVLGEGKTIAGITGEAYQTDIPSEGTARRAELAMDECDRQLEALKAERRPMQKGEKRADYLEASRARNQQIAGLEALKTSIKSARRAYLEYFESKLRDKPDRPAPGIKHDDPVAAEKKAAVEKLLADPRVSTVTAENASPAVSRFDPVALTLLKRPTGNLTAEQRAIAEALERTDAAREKQRTADSIEARAELAEALTHLKKRLIEYRDNIAPEGTKELVTDKIGRIDVEVDSVTKPTSGTGESMTTPEGTYTVKQRLQFEKAKPTGGDYVRKVADLTTRPMGAIMIYSYVTRQKDLQEKRDDEQVDLPEYLIGMAHTAYGVSVGVRMLHKIEVSPTEFVILGVIDVIDTASHHYATDAERKTAITYSLVRNGLQVGLMFIGNAMMKSKRGPVAAAGFLVQFAVDPFLQWVGLYDYLERRYDFLPDDVVRVRQRIRPLMEEYTVLVGLLELQQGRAIGDDKTKAEISSQLDEYRAKVLSTEKNLMQAFAEGYEAAKLSYAGLPELDTMRAQFLQLQFRAHQGDTAHAVESRKEILSWIDYSEGKLSLDAMTADEVGNMRQWVKLEEAISRLELMGPWLVKHRDKTNWASIIKKERELEQMLDNARYRLDPSQSGLRTAPLLKPGSAARAAYEKKLAWFEARVTTWRGRLFDFAPVGGTDPNSSLARVNQMVTVYAQALAAMPAFEGYTADQMSASSLALGKVYPDYVSSHSSYRAALNKLEAAEIVLKSMLSRFALEATQELAVPESSAFAEGARNVHSKVFELVSKRLAMSYFFVDEAKQRSVAARHAESVDVAKQLGETDPRPLSTPERTAINQLGLDVSTGATVVDRLNAMPMLAKVDKDGYMGRIFRYVDSMTSIAENAIVGDLGRTAEVADPLGDGKVTVHLYVPLSQGAMTTNFFGSHFFLRSPFIGGRPYADLPRGTVAFYDDDLGNLKRIRFEELKP
jgi:hypothetical protein